MNVTRPLHTLAVGLTALGMTAASLATENGSPTTAFAARHPGLARQLLPRHLRP
jgi:hypothetical protein